MATEFVVASTKNAAILPRSPLLVADEEQRLLILIAKEDGGGSIVATGDAYTRLRPFIRKSNDRVRISGQETVIESGLHHYTYVNPDFVPAPPSEPAGTAMPPETHHDTPEPPPTLQAPVMTAVPAVEVAEAPTRVSSPA